MDWIHWLQFGTSIWLLVCSAFALRAARKMSRTAMLYAASVEEHTARMKYWAAAGLFLDPKKQPPTEIPHDQG